MGSYTNPSNFGLVHDSLRSDMRYVMGGGGLPNVKQYVALWVGRQPTLPAQLITLALP